MTNLKRSIQEIIQDNIFGICAWVVCFFIILEINVFVKNYTGSVLVFEFVNTFLCSFIFLAIFYKFLQTRLADVLYFSYGIFFCCLIALLRNWFLLFYKPGIVIGVDEAVALSHIIEMVFFACFSCVAIFLKMRPTQLMEGNKILIPLSLGAIIASVFFSSVVFFVLPKALTDSEHAVVFVRLSLLFFSISQGIIMVIWGYSTWTMLTSGRSFLLWDSLTFLFLFISNVFFYDSIVGTSSLGAPMMFKTCGFIMIFIRVSNEFRVLFKKRLEYSKALEKAIQEKTREMARKSKAFEALREKSIESQETSRIKSELLANMSHELRTPMNSIIGFTSRVIKKSEEELPDRQMRNLRTVLRNAYHLLSLINTILDVSKIEAGRMKVLIEEFQLSPIVEEVLEMGRSLLGGKDINLVNDMPTEIVLRSDRTKIKQMLVNLVGNAIKFTERGVIKVSVVEVETIMHDTDAPSKSGVSISVADTGIGIKQEDIRYIFDDYKQVDDSLTRKTGGTGLGLALVKRFSYFLGGTVMVESEYARGTTFTVKLPLDSSEYAGDERFKEEHKAGDTLSRTIVCCEEDKTLLRLYTSFFKNKGLDTKVVGDVESAFMVAKETYPRLITIDLLSPRRRGIDLIRRCKGNYYTKNILICATGFFNEKKYGYFLNIIDFVYKPVNNELVSHIYNTATHWCPSLENILLIDNDEMSLNLMHDLLLQEDTYRVRLARDLKESIHMLNKKIPNIVILDIMMPHLEGFKIVSEIATKRKLCDIPVILMASKLIEKGISEFYQSSRYFLPPKGELKSEEVLKKISSLVKDVL